jgi:hypothetical protein
MIEELKKCIAKDGSLNTKRIKGDLLDFVNKIAPSWCVSLVEKTYCVINKIQNLPKCIECGSTVSFQNFNKGYKQYCSLKCSNNSTRVKEKKKQTNLEKYGAANPYQSDAVKAKIKATCLALYGEENPAKSTAVRDKISKSTQQKTLEEKQHIQQKREDTTLQRFGVTHISKLDEVKQKKANTCISNFGVSNIWKNEEKRKEVFNNALGVDNPFQSEEVKEKIKQILIDKYGYPNPSNILKFQEKKKQTFLEKYGSEQFLSSTQYREQRSEYNFNKVIDRIKNASPSFLIDEYTGVKTLYNWQCNICSAMYLGSADNGKEPRCPFCFPKYKSIGEQEVQTFIESLGFNVQSNNRDIIAPKEIDIFIPELSIGIEYNGLWWHSEYKKDKMYHYNKWNMCNQKNIRLISIFEDSWFFKQAIIKHRLLSILGKAPCKVYARNCHISEINTNEARAFLEAWHLDGYAKSSIKIGLFDKNELVSVMTFAPSRFDKDKTKFEIIRFASAKLVVGGASKLFSFFKNKYTPRCVISYADLAWGNGSVYKAIGFNLEKITTPGYFYFNCLTQQRENRLTLSKKQLVKLGFDASKTEFEIMNFRKEYIRIWDCGHAKYIWESTNG